MKQQSRFENSACGCMWCENETKYTFPRNNFPRWLLMPNDQIRKSVVMNVRIKLKNGPHGDKMSRPRDVRQHNVTQLHAAAPWLRPFSTSQPAMQTTSRSTPSGRCSSTTSSWTSSSSSTLMASKMRMGGTALLWRVSRLRNSASSSSLPFSKRAFWKEKSGKRFYQSIWNCARQPRCCNSNLKNLSQQPQIASVENK